MWREAERREENDRNVGQPTALGVLWLAAAAASLAALVTCVDVFVWIGDVPAKWLAPRARADLSQSRAWWFHPGVCFSTFSHHLRHHHRTTISGQDHTTSSFLNELGISLTLTFYKNAFQTHLLTFPTLIFLVFIFLRLLWKRILSIFSIKRILDWIRLEFYRWNV